ncbi:MAG TPA: AMP-dependent synthetase/ligase [Candidatus Limnocylindrales bacterium]|nr:AMP-dependent synthetase/ligase [Candidatus Limnocylindrales bacterium]
MDYAQPPVVVISDQAQLTDPVWFNAEQHARVVQFVDHGATITCAEFRDQVVRLAHGLRESGIKPGDRVALMSKTRYEWTLIDYSIWAAGGITVPIYETSSAEQVEWILKDSGAVACFAETAAHAVTIRSVAPELPLWQIDAVELPLRSGEGFERHRGFADDPATIVYTSGTTGRAKGCVLTHRNMLSDIGNAIPALDRLFHEGASTVLFLPLAHSFARLLQIGAVQGRVSTSFTADVKNLVDDLAKFKPTFVLSVPRVFEKVYTGARQRAHAAGRGAIFDRAEKIAIAYSEAQDQPSGPGTWLRLQHKLFDKLVYSRLREALGGRCHSAISGGAPLGMRLGHFFRGVGLVVLEGYGLTETSPALTFNRPGPHPADGPHRRSAKGELQAGREGAIRIGTVGQPLPGVTLRIDADGEILAKGEVVFPGYWNNSEATAEVIDDDGWFHTGDLGSLDADGFLTITGRKKEIIVTAAGKNVAPAALEDRIRAHPLVSQCMVIGDRRPFIAALITIDPEALAGSSSLDTPVQDITTDPNLRARIQEAIDEANKAVSKAEAVKVFRILPRDFTEASGELTPSLKVKRAVVMKEYADEIDAIYRR